jgi:uncharacterized protein
MSADITNDMTESAYWRRLTDAASGRVTLVRHGRPVVFPVNHVTDGRTIVFRTGASSVLGLLASRHPVTFEVDDACSTSATGRNVTVLVTGELERVNREDRARIDPQPTPWAPGRVEAWLRIRPITVTASEVPTNASDSAAPRNHA